ncbi:MAG: hypothetical protein B7Z37_22325 [Verrucomicrobia bacterium 12-59-8]|nr:MAG: hypothetical protein B7Z37_22325 [Verrucomicrobia bacterium 12-59-8]
MSASTRHILLIAAMFWISGGALRAQLSGSDDFNDNSKNAASWGTDAISGGASLVEANGRLEYRVATPDTVNGIDEAVRPWVLNTSPNSAVFDVTLDVSNNVNPSGDHTNASIGLVVTSLENAEDSIFIELFRGGNLTDGKGFLAVLSSAAAGGEVLPYTIPTAHGSVTTASVRLSYDPVSKIFTAYYDTTGSDDGFQWQVYGSFGVGAFGGGTTLNSPWQLSQNLGFKVSVGGFSEGQVVASGAVYADNFVARTLALSALSLSSGVLSPQFDGGTINYLTCVSNDTTSVTVTPSTTFSNATLTVNGAAVASGTASADVPLHVGSNLISIGIASQDGYLTNTYTANVIRHCTTVLSGSENFDDNARDAAKWDAPDDLNGGASLSEVNGRFLDAQHRRQF